LYQKSFDHFISAPGNSRTGNRAEDFGQGAFGQSVQTLFS